MLSVDHESGLTIGKISYADATICPICLSEEDSTYTAMRELQTIINNIARVVPASDTARGLGLMISSRSQASPA